MTKEINAEQNKNELNFISKSISMGNFVYSINKSTKEMQQMLIKLGYDCGAAGADGILGTNTKKAIKAFQKNNQLTVDGIYGPKTEKVLLQKYNEL